MPRPTGHRPPIAAQSIHHRPDQPSNSRAMTDTFTPTRLVALVLVAGLALGACGGTTSSTQAETDKQVMQRFERHGLNDPTTILIVHHWETPERAKLARHLAYLDCLFAFAQDDVTSSQRADEWVTRSTLDHLVGIRLPVGNGKSQ